MQAYPMPDRRGCGLALMKATLAMQDPRRREYCRGILPDVTNGKEVQAARELVELATRA